METQDTNMVSESTSDANIENSADLRCRIMEVARAKFTEVGYSRVSMSEIAQDLRISKKTVYREFETKEDLLRAIVFPKLQKSAERCDAFMSDPATSFPERLTFLMGIIGESGERASSVLMRDVYTQAPAIWEEVNRFRKKRMTKLEALIQDGIEKGYLRKDISATLAARFYGAASEALMTPAVLAELPFTGKEVYTTLITILFEGIMTEETRKNFHMQDPIQETDPI